MFEQARNIGLLKPAHVASNGYRHYRRPEALKLQEILFYRAAGMQLRDIAELLDDSVPLDRLLIHRRRLVQSLTDQATMIATLDRTISHLTGDAPMTIEDLYQPFSAQKQAEYENWLVDTYGPDMIANIAKTRLSAQGNPEKFYATGQEHIREIAAALVANYEAGTAPEEADMSAHQSWMADMWGRPCDGHAYSQLSEVYMAHPDFIARFEALSEGLSQWLRDAMVAWPQRK